MYCSLTGVNQSQREYDAAACCIMNHNFTWNVSLQDTKGMTCFHLATRQGHTDLMKLLLKSGKFDINEKVRKVQKVINEIDFEQIVFLSSVT